MTESSIQTNEFSFVLKPSLIPNAGIGVFSTHVLPVGIKIYIAPKNARSRRLKSIEIPAAFRDYCIAEEDDWYRCPLRFNRMEIGWYINHSFNPNIEKREDGFYTLRTILVDEEIVMDYNTLNEPVEKKEAYYL